MKSKKNGFTFVELMVVVVLISILSGIAMPSIWKWHKERVVSGAVEKIQRVLQLARIEAIKQNGRVIVKFTAGKECDGIVQVFRDLDLSWSYNAGDSEILLDSMPRGVELLSATFFGSYSTLTSYDRIGLPTPGQNGSVILANIEKNSFRKITLSSAGNLKIEKQEEAF